MKEVTKYSNPNFVCLQKQVATQKSELSGEAHYIKL